MEWRRRINWTCKGSYRSIRHWQNKRFAAFNFYNTWPLPKILRKKVLSFFQLGETRCVQEVHLALFPNISPTRVQQKREKREELKEIPSSSSLRPVVVVGNPIGMPPPPFSSFPPLLPSGGLTTHDDSMWHGKERERERIRENTIYTDSGKKWWKWWEVYWGVNREVKKEEILYTSVYTFRLGRFRCDSDFLSMHVGLNSRENGGERHVTAEHNRGNRKGASNSPIFLKTKT